jgi:hypothetical protein
VLTKYALRVAIPLFFQLATISKRLDLEGWAWAYFLYIF